MDTNINPRGIFATRKDREQVFQVNGKSFTLTGREVEVLCLIGKGETNKGMASELGLSVKTVEKHRQNIMKKSRLHSGPALIHYALSRGLVQNLFADEPNG